MNLPIAIPALLFVAGLINLVPVVGLFSAERMATLYGVVIDTPDLQILMRHRALMFGLIGGLLFAAIPLTSLRPAAYALGLASMAGFIVIALAVGDPGPRLQRVIQADIVGIICLLGALALSFVPAASP